MWTFPIKLGSTMRMAHFVTIIAIVIGLTLVPLIVFKTVGEGKSKGPDYHDPQYEVPQNDPSTTVSTTSQKTTSIPEYPTNKTTERPTETTTLATSSTTTKNSPETTTATGSPKPELKYSRILTLDENLTVEWTTDMTQVFFRVTCKSRGFIGFGFTPNGGMKGSDMVIGGVDDATGQPYFTDRHATGNFEPEVDAVQNWFLDSASQSEDTTILEFHRALDTCDDQDSIIDDATLKFIWSYGATDKISYHGSNRGSHSVNVLSPSVDVADTSEFDAWTMEMGAEVLPEETVYHCQVYKSPPYGPKRHIVGFEVNQSTPEAQEFNHHIVLFHCDTSNPDNVALMEELAETGAADCYWSDYVYLTDACQKAVFAWAVGGQERRFLPDDVGLPFNDLDDGPIFYMVQYHWDNPQLKKGNWVSSQMKVFSTPTLRTHEAGVLTTGHAVLPSMVVPPDSENFMITGHCDSSCISQHFPSDGVNVISVFQHSHLAGRSITTRHFRPMVNERNESYTQELPPIASNPTYNFDFQETVTLRTPVKLMPGDHITTQCIYNTKWRQPSSVTLGGLGTRDEMCETYLLYYPRVKTVDTCQSFGSLLTLAFAFGILGVDGNSGSVWDPTISKPPAMAGKNLSTVLNTMTDWTPQLVQRYQDMIRNGEHYSICMAPYQSYADAILDAIGDGFISSRTPGFQQYPPSAMWAELDRNSGSSTSAGRREPRGGSTSRIGYPKNIVEYQPPPRNCPTSF